MPSETVPIAEQIIELELSCLALQNMIARARNGEIKRPPEWLSRRERAAAALWAALETLVGLQKGRAA